MPITEAKNADALLFGLGTLGWSSLPLASPAAFTDVGYIKSCKVAYSRELKEFTSAGLLVKRLVFRDRLSLEAQFAEVSMPTLNRFLFQGTLANFGSGTNNHVSFGGQKTLTRFGVRFEHTKDDGKIVQIDLYRAAPSSEAEFNFAEEDFILYPVKFDAELDTGKPAGRQYGSVALI